MNAATWIDSAPRRERALASFAWPGAVSAALLLGIVSGGSSQASSAAFLAFRVLCIAIFAVALLRLLSVRLAMAEKLSLLLMAASVAVVSLQLVPLPYGLFASLPGRDLVAKVFSIAAIPPRAMPVRRQRP